MKTVLLAAFAALSQPGESPRRTEVADLSWREGCWEGEGFGGAISECWLAAFAAQAQPEEARVRADIADLAWLEGCWEGEGFGGAISECWMRGPTGRLTGTFQLLEPDGTQRFSEILLLDVFEDDHQLCLVTELMRGGDLFKHLSKASTFTEGEAARLARQIVSAVAHLHEHGVVSTTHCDRKAPAHDLEACTATSKPGLPPCA